MRLEDVLLDAVRKASSYVRSKVLDLRSRDVVGARADDVTRRIDLDVERLVIEFVKKHDVSAVVLTEEQGLVRTSDRPKHVLVIDPLDGSANFVSNVPFYSISIAVGEYSDDVRARDLSFGLVHNIPLDVTYLADLETESFRIYGQDFQLDVDTHRKPMAVVYVEPRSLRDLEALHLIWEVFDHNVKLRTFGSASLEIVGTMLNKFALFVDLRGKLRVFDIAGAYVIARALRGHVVDDDGRDVGDLELLKLPRTNVIASRDHSIVDKLVVRLRNVLSKQTNNA